MTKQASPLALSLFNFYVDELFMTMETESGYENSFANQNFKECFTHADDTKLATRQVITSCKRQYFYLVTY